MKATSKFLVFISTIAFLLGGCATSLQSVKMKEGIVEATPRESLSVMYSKTYFQERFMGKSIGTAIVFGPLIGAVLWHYAGDYENKTAARLESSQFEKLLGDFDVSDYFFTQLDQKIIPTKYINLTFTQDINTAQQVLQFIKCDSSKMCVIEDKTIKDRFSCVTALKMAYGLGARQGSEQIGFSKSYRPFIRLIGITKDLNTNAILWRDDIIVFGNKRYKGSDANADRIDREELVSTFKNLTSQSIALLQRSLNGEELGEMPILVDTTSADLDF